MEAPRARYSYMLRPFVRRRISVVYFLRTADTRDAAVLRVESRRCAMFVEKEKHVKM